MKELIFVVGIMSVNVFFSISSIIGYEFMGSSQSKVYIIYAITIASMNIFLLIKGMFKKEIRFFRRDFLLLSVPLIFIFIFLTTGLINGTFNVYATKFMGYFLLWGLPSILIGFYVRKKGILPIMVKWIEIIMLVFSMSIITSNIIPYLRGFSSVSIGGATYQSASYISAFAFGLNLYFLFFGKNHERFFFTKKKGYKAILIVLLFVQIIGIFLTGGRGGIVLAIVYAIALTYEVLIISDGKTKLKFLLVFLLFSIGLLLIMPGMMKNNIFSERFYRVFEFISLDQGINWKGTSNRDLVFKNAIELINKRKFFGYGLFGFWDVSGYPHNIVLEILLNGGVLYLSLVIIILIKFLKNLYFAVKYDPRIKIIAFISLYPLVYLFLSGTYMSMQEFWFVFGFVLTSPVNVPRSNPNEVYSKNMVKWR